MAKSTRSKVKRAFRAKKRESGIYAATEAARLDRLNAKLSTVRNKEKEDDTPLVHAEGRDGDDRSQSSVKSSRVSTHGPRGSRREEWRKSKGMDPVPKRHGMNRQGGLAARRKAGRPSRRR
ncbi:hypothetical protein F5I97DRAFT_1935979 [Phlebopus sp. FC_14]|nr:hypothetical protein F5I97DRAFT_1935979 [Phlebopus sp. FC_14]